MTVKGNRIASIASMCPSASGAIAASRSGRPPPIRPADSARGHPIPGLTPFEHRLANCDDVSCREFQHYDGPSVGAEFIDPTCQPIGPIALEERFGGLVEWTIGARRDVKDVTVQPDHDLLGPVCIAFHPEAIFLERSVPG